MRVYTFIAALFVFVLASCSSQPVVLANAVGLPKSELAIIKIDRTDHPDWWQTFIRSVRDLDLESWTRMDGIAVHVAPGQYQLNLVAYKGNYEGYPKVTINARAGKTYLVHCIGVGDGKVGAFFKETDTKRDNPHENSSDSSSDKLQYESKGAAQ